MSNLPAYTEHRSTGGISEHSFKHEDANFCVHLISHAANKSSPPIFHNESLISGSIEFTLKTGPFSSIKSIVAEIRGTQRMMRDFGLSSRPETAELVFMSVKSTAWQSSPSYPKLKEGTNHVQFNLAFPRTFTSTNRKTRNEEFELPPTFSTPGFPLYLLYELRCTIHRGLLQEDLMLSIPVHYVPRREAASPTPARMLSYEAQTPLPDPSLDPEGWSAHAANCQLRAFGDRNVDIDFQLSLAAPLEYARGGIIPVHFTVTCHDDQTRALLCTPGAFAVHLRRRFRIGDARADFRPDKPYDDRSKDFVGKGTYWRTDAGTTPTRTFEGEIRVSGQLMQNFTYPGLSLHYAVQLYLTSPGLVCIAKGPMASVPVEITYLSAPGPRPISYAPPSPTGEETRVSYVGVAPPLRFFET